MKRDGPGAQPRAAQPTLFELREDHRPPRERNAAERYCEPSLFTRLEQPEGTRNSLLPRNFAASGTPAAVYGKKERKREKEKSLPDQVVPDGLRAAHTARTCSSLANSPRAAAAFDFAISARSSSESAKGGASPLPASRRIMRAMSS
jgi:hypothetical protein